MSKGTIIYIGGFELPDKNAAAHRVLGISKILRELDYQVVFLDVQEEIDNSSCPDEIQGFTCFHSERSHNFYQFFIREIKTKSTIKVIKQYDDVAAVIAYNYPAIALYRIKKYCNKRNIKVIADVTEWYSGDSSNILMKIIKKTDIFLRMQVIQPKLDGIIAISKYLHEYYSKKGCNTVMIPPLVDLEEEKWNGSILNEEHKEAVVLCYSGSPGNSKSGIKDRLDILVDALAQVNSYFILNIVGLTKEQFCEQFIYDSNKLDEIKGKIVFWGRVEHKLAMQVLKNSDFLVFLRERSIVTMAGFPTKLVESISSGVPVITNNSSNITDYVKHNNNGIIVRNIDCCEVAAQLDYVLKMDRTQISAMKNNCLNSGLFDYRNYINITMEFIDFII